MTGSQRGSVMGHRRQSEVGSVVSHATANTTASRCAPHVPSSADTCLPAHHPTSMGPVEHQEAWGMSSGVYVHSQVLTANRGTAAHRVSEGHRPARHCQGEDSTGLLH